MNVVSLLAGIGIAVGGILLLMQARSKWRRFWKTMGINPHNVSLSSFQKNTIYSGIYKPYSQRRLLGIVMIIVGVGLASIGICLSL